MLRIQILIRKMPLIGITAIQINHKVVVNCRRWSRCSRHCKICRCRCSCSTFSCRLRCRISNKLNQNLRWGNGCCCFCCPVGAPAAPAPAGAAVGAVAPGEPGFILELHHLAKPLPLSGPLGMRMTLGGKARPDTASSAWPKRRGGFTKTGCIIIMGDSMGMYLMLGPPLVRRPLCCCGYCCMLKLGAFGLSPNSGLFCAFCS